MNGLDAPLSIGGGEACNQLHSVPKALITYFNTLLNLIPLDAIRHSLIPMAFTRCVSRSSAQSTVILGMEHIQLPMGGSHPANNVTVSPIH